MAKNKNNRHRKVFKTLKSAIEIGRALADYRKKEGLSLEEMGKRMNLERNHYTGPFYNTDAEHLQAIEEGRESYNGDRDIFNKALGLRPKKPRVQAPQDNPYDPPVKSPMGEGFTLPKRSERQQKRDPFSPFSAGWIYEKSPEDK